MIYPININVYKNNNVFNKTSKPNPIYNNALPVDTICFKGNAEYNQAKNIYSSMLEAKSIAILTHKEPDGDGISSGLLLQEFLKTKFPDKKIEFLVCEKPSKLFSKLPGFKQIKILNPKENNNFDLAIMLDCDETYVDCESIYKNANKKVNIDHHSSNINLGTYDKLRIIDPKASSNTELIYEKFLLPLGIEPTDSMQECILTGILTDTGDFKYIKDKDRFSQTIDRIDRNSQIDIEKIFSKIRDKLSSSRAESEELCDLFHDIVDRDVKVEDLKTKSGHSVKYVVVDQDMIKNYKIEDAQEDIKSTLKSIVGKLKRKADIAIILWEKQNGEVRVSMRSEKAILSEFVEIFDGGGHKNAAGASLVGNKEENIEMFLELLKDFSFQEEP